MLDNETKRRIDTARDVLVGKVPDPKSQVEQITIALIYKFMDDMDKESVEMGGKASFFTGDYDKYAWSKMFDPRLGGFDMLALYSEAITRMSQNPNIPQLFRNIFKNAYLPYRDPETLKLFLKTINEFIYDHSERLGDAFEYLLSVLGSQGDAGQFRTPRHIIDFMVEVIKPQKNETILDPACGTAGFLISSYKYILKDNTKKIPGDLLTPDERKKLLANFKGYDISPDMVRLSLVNLYLHGFVQPQIMEYDTLTSEDRWNDYADVILANPPFMSPKGGIKPHKKFSVQSNRSEVLFVDYIAEHLKPTGRAAVIVPEGIIFQSAGAYKQLRKMLVENHLYAVVSLPAGVFNPYSGVKTSILFMDRSIAKKTDSILFVKIENDGYGLGAQRREQVGSDLPDAVSVIADYVKAVHSGIMDTFKPEDLSRVGSRGKPCGALLVSKEKLAENDDYNLTGDRYRTTERKVHQKWPMVELGEVCNINPSKAEVKNLQEDYEVSFVPMEDLKEFRADFASPKSRKLGEVIKSYTYFRNGDVILARVTPCFENGKAGIAKDLKNGIGFGSSEYFVFRAGESVLPGYVYRVLMSDHFRENGMVNMTGTGGLQRVPVDYVQTYRIPLPPLEVQREIVAEIEGYQKLIDGARQVVESWKPQIEIDPAWSMVKLGEVGELKYGFTVSAEEQGTARFIRITDISEDGLLIQTEPKYVNISEDNIDYLLKKGDLLVARTGATYGKTLLFNENIKAIYASYLIRIRFQKEDVLSDYYWAFAQSEKYWSQAHNLMTGGGQPQFNGNVLKEISFPLPPLSVQRSIVSKIEAERKVVDGCKELIALYEAKIKKVIDKVWEN